MPIDYGIKAIPTMYQGRQYRSRLEAKWAAFFDLLGFRFEYEPGDLGLWSPDFMLLGKNGRRVVLVEVKPITEFDTETALKIERACPPDLSGAVLLVGISPFLPVGAGPRLARPAWVEHGPEIGWHTVMGGEESESWGATYTSPTDETNEMDIFPDGFPDGFLTGQSPSRRDTSSVSRTRQLWAEATNIVRWLPR